MCGFARGGSRARSVTVAPGIRAGVEAIAEGGLLESLLIRERNCSALRDEEDWIVPIICGTVAQLQSG